MTAEKDPRSNQAQKIMFKSNKDKLQPINKPSRDSYMNSIKDSSLMNESYATAITTGIVLQPNNQSIQSSEAAARRSPLNVIENDDPSELY